MSKILSPYIGISAKTRSGMYTIFIDFTLLFIANNSMNAREDFIVGR